MSISMLLDRTLSLQRQTITVDASGGAVRAFPTILANIPCAIVPARASVVADYARRDLLVNHHVYTTTDLDSAVSGGVGLTDRLTDGANLYLVKGVLKFANAAVSAEPLYQLDCEQLKP